MWRHDDRNPSNEALRYPHLHKRSADLNVYLAGLGLPPLQECSPPNRPRPSVAPNQPEPSLQGDLPRER